MELDQIRAFTAVVNHRSFTKAAEELHLSQPAVTRQIAALEQYLGARLLERRIRHVTPTAAGAVFHAHATRILSLESDCRTAVLAVERGTSGTLRVAASGTSATYLLPDLLGRFRARHPAIDIRVHTCSSGEAARLTVEEQADAAVVMDLQPHPDLKQILAGRYSLVAAMSPSHPLSRRSSIAMADLASEPLIVMLPGTNLRRLVDSLFHVLGSRPRIAVETDHLEAMKKMAGARLGVAIVPDLAVSGERGLRVVPIRGARRTRHWSVICRKDRQQAAPIRFFLECVRLH